MLWFFAGLAVLFIAAWVVGRQRAFALTRASAPVHSLPSYHGAWAALSALLPAALVFIAGALVNLPYANAAGLVAGLAGAGWAYSRISPDFRARNMVEKIVMVFLIACSAIAIVTTIGIVASVLLESLLFFSEV